MRDLAEALMPAVTGLGGADAPTRARFDHLLLTVHEQDGTAAGHRP
ncbi:hypothetical protein ACFVAV_31360 [Nocardia sp. NPDC057663]